jgi:spermidine synthase
MKAQNSLDVSLAPHRKTEGLTRVLRLLAYPCFLGSGAAGLVYEVVWTRLLLAQFGAGLYAICAVLAAFMGGLALGSWLLGRVGDRMRRPLLLYAGLELAIGVCGAGLLWLLPHVGVVDAWAYQKFGQHFGVLTAFRFGIALLLMLIPTTLMGATLPVLSRFMVREQKHLGLHVGALYAINTFGALAGAFAAGFLLIGKFGLNVTGLIAVGLNLAVAVAAGLLAMAVERPMALAQAAGAKTRRKPLTGDAHWILFTAFVSGLVSLAAQVLWSRSLVFSFEYLKNTTYTFSAMLTVFLAGLAIGSALISLVIDHQREPLRLYGTLLGLIGIAMILSVSVLYFGSGLLQIGDPLNAETNQFNWVIAVGNVMLQTVGVLGIPTLLMGMAFPVAARVFAGVVHVGSDVGRLYSLNTLGAICGSVLAGFVIIPLLGLTGGLLLLGGIDALLGIATLARSPRWRMHTLLFGVLAVVMLGVVWWGLPKGRGLQPPMTPGEQTVFYKEGPLATVAVLENMIGDRTIYVDGVGVAGTDDILQTDQKSLAHVPMMLLRAPSSALTVGFGSGGASYSLQLHDLLTRIHCVEICSTMFDAAPTLTAANHDFFGKLNPWDFAAQNNRYKIVLDDARAWLRYTRQHYDFISTDCTDLRYKSNANLYDREYFQACRDRLTPEGIVVVWMPLAGLSQDCFKVALRTFYRVFPQMGVFYMANVSTHYILLIGWQQEIKLDYALFAQRLREEDVRQDLGELYLDDPVKLLSCFITGGAKLGQYLAGDALNTQDFPYLEFESPKYGYGDRPLLDNLNDLMAPDVRVSPREFLNKATIPAKELERLERYERALPFIIKGHAAYRLLDIETATKEYLRAAELTPEDLNVRRGMLGFPVLARRIQNEPNNYYPVMQLGRALMLQGRTDGAYDLLVRAEGLLKHRLADVPPKDEARKMLEAHAANVRGWLAVIRRAQAAAEVATPPAGETAPGGAKP